MDRLHHIVQVAHNHQEQVKHTVDGIAGVVTVGALVSLLPQISAILSIIWLLIRIYETKTVQRYLDKDTKKDD